MARTHLAAALALTLALVTRPTSAQALSRNALWTVVHACLLDEAVFGAAFPCDRVDRAAGYVVLSDPKRATQILVAPAARVAGIESPRLQAADAPNLWRIAWDERGRVSRRAKRAVPDADVGLAVNSLLSRTQDHLHIHIDCLRSDVREAIDASIDQAPTNGWRPFPQTLRRRRYLVR